MNHIEVWLDTTSDAYEPKWCVSLCREDGGEISCLAVTCDRGRAEAEGRRLAKKGRLEVFTRDPTGCVKSLA